MKERLLITGAGGFLGWHLCDQAVRSWRVYGLRRSGAIRNPDVEPVAGDITDQDRLRRVFDRIAPDAVVHAAALSDPNTCQQRPGESRRTNLEATVFLAGLCASRKIPMAFTSTDLVFAGRNSPYSENDPIDPVCTYGVHKAGAEARVLSIHPEALVCRMPLMFGYTGSASVCFDTVMIRAIREGRPLRLFSDEYRTPVDGESAARGILRFLGKERGLFHLGGRKRVSRLETGRILERLMGVSRSRIHPVSLEEVRMSAPRAADITLDSRRAYAAGFDPAPLEKALRRSLERCGAVPAPVNPAREPA